MKKIEYFTVDWIDKEFNLNPETGLMNHLLTAEIITDTFKTAISAEVSECTPEEIIPALSGLMEIIVNEINKNIKN